MRRFRDYDDDLRAFVEAFLRFDTTDGDEAPAQAWLRSRLDDLGFETIEWEADADRLATHPSFPDDPDEIPVDGRPSVAGVLEFGDPDAGPTLVLNGHTDVVPADDALWTSDPFEPTWDDAGEELTARGAVDMKASVAACVFAARTVADSVEAGTVDLDGRVVVEAVAGEEDGGIGAAAAALDSPYDFERDAAIVAEPSELNVVVATEGCLMKRLELTGRSAHAARRWRGEDVLPRFERIRRAFADLEAERAERVSHPLYERFDCPWPITVGRVRAGSWASNVPASLVAECRLGVAPGETLAEVEAEYEAALEAIVDEDEWLSAHEPSFERFSVQFAPAEISPDEPIVELVQGALRDRDLDPTPVGETYGADSRYYVEAGVPSVIFGPGTIDEAHFPDETLVWDDLLDAGEIITETIRRFLAADG